MAATAVLQKTIVITDDQARRLNSRTVFFGHQSVGDNILDGLRELIASDPRLTLRVVRSAYPETLVGPAFIESHIGQNRQPDSKNAHFASILGNGMGLQGGIALFKYCYIDFGPSTDVPELFRSYKALMDELKAKYSSLVLVHATAPLTTDDVSANAAQRVRSVLRKMLGRDPNVKRNRFNELLRKAYLGKDPVFDLAEMESTRPDGTRTAYRRGIRQIYTLVPEFSSDGGHLNQEASRIAAETLLLLLASL